MSYRDEMNLETDAFDYLYDEKSKAIKDYRENKITKKDMEDRIKYINKKIDICEKNISEIEKKYYEEELN